MLLLRLLWLLQLHVCVSTDRLRNLIPTGSGPLACSLGRAELRQVDNGSRHFVHFVARVYCTPVPLYLCTVQLYLRRRHVGFGKRSGDAACPFRGV